MGTIISIQLLKLMMMVIRGDNVLYTIQKHLNRWKGRVVYRPCRAASIDTVFHTEGTGPKNVTQNIK